MSKIVYLFGAGASYGERYTTNNGQKRQGAIMRGVPIVNEFVNSIGYLISDIESTKASDQFPATQEQIENIIENLNWLKEKCNQYPTIDTYAKQLFITEGIKGENYLKLKNALSLFLTLSQKKEKRDLRYDGFIASLIQEKLKFPDEITLLSWNYDCQFEFAFADYLKDKGINDIWKALNVSCKTTNYRLNSGFGVVKLNGTAMAYDNKKGNQLWDIFFNTQGMSLENLAEMHFVKNTYSTNVKNALSFAWEQDDDFTKQLFERVKNAETLVVIGYSFPYVNRTVDRSIIQSMTNLRKVYIQDPIAEEIKESFEATLLKTQTLSIKIEYVLRTGLNQFVIPNELS